MIQQDAGWVSASLPLSFLTVGAVWPLASSRRCRCHDSPAARDCVVLSSCEPEETLPPLSCFCWCLFCLVLMRTTRGRYIWKALKREFLVCEQKQGGANKEMSLEGNSVYLRDQSSPRKGNSRQAGRTRQKVLNQGNGKEAVQCGTHERNSIFGRCRCLECNWDPNCRRGCVRKNYIPLRKKPHAEWLRRAGATTEKKEGREMRKPSKEYGHGEAQGGRPMREFPVQDWWGTWWPTPGIPACWVGDEW